MTINKIGIVGGSNLGSEIARLAAQQGFSVIIAQKFKEKLDQIITSIKNSIDHLIQQKESAETEKAKLIGRLQLSLDLKALNKVDLILIDQDEGQEGLFETYRELDLIIPPQVRFISTSSTVSVTKVARETNRSSNVIGIHFLDPIEDLKFVEIVRGVQTSKETMKQAQEFVERLELQWVMTHDFPGYLVNRIIAPMINEAVNALFEGVAPAEDIDKAICLGNKFPMGPLATADRIGLDKILKILENMYQSTGNPKFVPCPLLVKYVEAGYYGKKSGKGFYDYNKENSTLKAVS